MLKYNNVVSLINTIFAIFEKLGCLSEISLTYSLNFCFRTVTLSVSKMSLFRRVGSIEDPLHIANFTFKMNKIEKKIKNFHYALIILPV